MRWLLFTRDYDSQPRRYNRRTENTKAIALVIGVLLVLWATGLTLYVHL
jgi:hypothetical protein